MNSIPEIPTDVETLTNILYIASGVKLVIMTLVSVHGTVTMFPDCRFLFETLSN